MKLKILEIGKMVPEFEPENIFVLFGQSAPPELREISVIIDFEKNDNGIYFREGSKLVISGKEYTITEVGDLANSNFHELGHLSVYLNKDIETLPGAVHAIPDEFPRFKVGDEIEIIYWYRIIYNNALKI